MVKERDKKVAVEIYKELGLSFDEAVLRLTVRMGNQKIRNLLQCLSALKDDINDVNGIKKMSDDQRLATEMYAREKARERERQTAVEVYQELGITFDETIQRLAAKFSLENEEATEYVNQYWKQS